MSRRRPRVPGPPRRLKPADRLDDREPGAYRTLGIIFVRLGIAEINEHAVAHVFRDKAGKAAHRIGDAAMLGGHDLAQILGIEARADSGVEPTRSQNITVSWRRSALVGPMRRRLPL